MREFGLLSCFQIRSAGVNYVPKIMQISVLINFESSAVSFIIVVKLRFIRPGDTVGFRDNFPCSRRSKYGVFQEGWCTRFKVRSALLLIGDVQRLRKTCPLSSGFPALDCLVNTHYPNMCFSVKYQKYMALLKSERDSTQ